MKAKKPITLVLRAKHFRDVCYDDNLHCPLAQAAKEQFNTDYANEGVDNINIGKNTMYNHQAYDATHFDLDESKACAKKFNNSIIRKIVLTPHDPQANN